MRRIDWRALLIEQGVPFVERGPNVKRGELNIRCPFCGPADPSHHMGINPDSGWWACWRNSQHRGKSPIRLLMSLLRIPYREAAELAGIDADYVDPEGFDALAARILGMQKVQEGAKAATTRRLRWPRGYEQLRGQSWARRHREYLRVDRGFTFIDDLVDEFDLRGTFEDAEFRDRVLLPYRLDGSMVAWTGRAIGPALIRYKDLPLDSCIVPIKHTLFLHDEAAAGGKWLIFVEGPIDALKLTFYGRAMGVYAVAFSTSSIRPEQVAQAAELADSFDHVGVMADNEDAIDIIASGQLRDQLAVIPRIRALAVPFGRKDAGALTSQEASQFTSELATRRQS